MRNRILSVAALLAASVLSASAGTITVDGSITGDAYGPARAVQTVETGFGDNFSELDAAYGAVRGGRLFLGLTGNIEANFNKLEIFIDSQAGGENTLSGLPGNDNANRMAGLTFDSGFTADYHLIVRRGFDGFGGFGDGKFDVDFAALGGVGTFSSYEDIFNDGSMPNGGGVEGSGMTGTGVNASPIDFAYNNSNIAGVGGGNGAAADQSAAAAVQTGLELSIDLADLGSPTGDFKVMAFVNGGGHDFASNQFLGGVPVGTSNLGGDGAGNFTGVVNFDLNQFAGDQFFTVPEPASFALLTLGALALLRRR